VATAVRVGNAPSSRISDPHLGMRVVRWGVVGEYLRPVGGLRWQKCAQIVNNVDASRWFVGC